MWFRLYVLRDRGFMRSSAERAAAGCSTLVFTVDSPPTPGARYRDAHSGMAAPKHAAMRPGTGGRSRT